VGSGFDVACAVYGSCVYRRFSPSLLDTLGSGPGSQDFASKLRALVDNETETWDAVVDHESMEMPSGLRLALADVDCGSTTPGMVKKVLEWRKKDQKEAAEIWTALDAANQSLAIELSKLKIEKDQGDGSHGNYDDLKKRIATIRELIRKMTTASGVPIEPAEQTKLLDTCTQVDGVIGGVVPGAGGYDAVTLLIEDSAETLERLKLTIQQFTLDHQKSCDKASRSVFGNVSLLGVKQDNEGIRLEDPRKYAGWIIRREESQDSWDGLGALKNSTSQA